MGNKSDIMSLLMIIAGFIAALSGETDVVTLFFIAAAVFNLVGETKWYSQREETMKDKLEDRSRTGIERFYDRYPDYPRKEEEILGVGAMMVSPYKLYNNKNE